MVKQSKSKGSLMGRVDRKSITDNIIWLMINYNGL